ncbi:MAG: hypothetical protein V3R49_04960 [Gammaproteobacteria bacterium]
MANPTFQCLTCNAKIELTESLAALLTQIIEERWGSSVEFKQRKLFMEQRRLDAVQKINELSERKRLKNLKESIMRM